MDWKRKLTSRKFWMAVISFTANLLIAFGASENTASQVTAIIMAGAAVVSYLVAEGLTDASNTTHTVNTTSTALKDCEDNSLILKTEKEDDAL